MTATDQSTHAPPRCPPRTLPPTSPLPLRNTPLATTRSSAPTVTDPKMSQLPTLPLSTLGPRSTLNPPTSLNDLLPLTPTRKRDRTCILSTPAYAPLTSSTLHSESTPGSFNPTSSSFSFGLPPASNNSPMGVCQSSPDSPFDSRALDYFGKAKAVVTTHTHTIRSGLGLWPDTKACENETDPDPETERASKRRKGVAGTIISTALDAAFDAAIFTSAVGYAAFQIWRGKPLDEPSRTRLPAPVPHSPPPPYEQCSTPLPLPLPRSRPTPVKRASSAQRKVTHIHVPRPRPAKPYLSSTSTTSIPNFTLESLNINSPTPTPGPEPAPEEEEEDLMADFVPSFSHYVPPPPVPDEPVDLELETDEELVAWKNQIQGLIRSGEAALAAMPELPIAPELEPELQQMVVKEEGVKRSEEVQILERALDQTARGTGRNWWEIA